MGRFSYHLFQCDQVESLNFFFCLHLVKFGGLARINREAAVLVSVASQFPHSIVSNQ